MEIEIDKKTGLEHIPPAGMEHHNQRKKGTGRWYATVKASHYIIKEIQDSYPDLAKKMSDDPTQATNIYSAFIAMLPLQVKSRLTPDLKSKIMKSYGLL